jgi:hypothetical protein
MKMAEEPEETQQEQAPTPKPAPKSESKIPPPATAKSPAELQKEEFERQEKLRAAQTQFDPKKHGVGTHPVTTPQSVAELWKLIQPMYEDWKGYKD